MEKEPLTFYKLLQPDKYLSGHSKRPDQFMIQAFLKARSVKSTLEAERFDRSQDMMKSFHSILR